MWCLTGNEVACGSSPGGGGTFFPFIDPLIVSLRLGYLMTKGSCKHNYKLLADRQYFKSLRFMRLQFTSLFFYTEKQLITIVITLA